MDSNYPPPFSPAVSLRPLSIYTASAGINPCDGDFNMDWGAAQQALLLNARFLSANQMMGGESSVPGYSTDSSPYPLPEVDPGTHSPNVDWAVAATLLNPGRTGDELSLISEPAPTTNNKCKWTTGGLVCNENFADFDSLMVHMGKVHDARGNRARELVCRWSTAGVCCGKKHRRNGLRRHVEAHLRRRVPCTECGKLYSRKDTLSTHLKKYHGKK